MAINIKPRQPMKMRANINYRLIDLSEDVEYQKRGIFYHFDTFFTPFKK